MPVRTLGERLFRARRDAFVGRAEELAAFRDALDGRPGAYAVAYLHGRGGIGKTSLLARFAEEGRARGRTVAEVDCAVIPPTPGDFSRAASEALGTAGTVLLIDGFERCQGLEGWLRERFLPGLAPSTVVVVAGRRPPDPLWALDIAWAALLHVRELGDLSPPEASALLRARAVPDALHADMLRFAGGYPLALSLAAATRGEGGLDRFRARHDVTGALLERLVENVPSADHRVGLGACAYVWRTTEELLRELCGGAAGEVFGWLRRQPFVEADRLGLFPHDVVREALRTDLRWRDPAGYELMHDAMMRRVFRCAREATGDAVEPAIRALQHMGHNNARLARLDVVASVGDIYADVLTPGDLDAVRDLARRWEGADAERVISYWTERQPGAFTVYRRSSGDAVAGVGATLRFVEPAAPDLAADPVLAGVWEHVGRAPLRPGRDLIVDRFQLPPAGHRPVGLAGLVQMKALETWVRTDRTDWSFMAVRVGARNVPIIRFGDHPLLSVVSFGGQEIGLHGHDWRAAPVEAWTALISRRILHGTDHGRDEPSFAVLDRREFETAVRDALRHWHHAAALRANPLVRTRMVAARTGDGGNPVDALRAVVREAADALRTSVRDGRTHRVLTATYLERVVTQETAAKDLGMPLSTYRRHLRRAVAHVAERLWRLDLR